MVKYGDRTPGGIVPSVLSLKFHVSNYCLLYHIGNKKVALGRKKVKIFLSYVQIRRRIVKSRQIKGFCKQYRQSALYAQDNKADNFIILPHLA